MNRNVKHTIPLSRRTVLAAGTIAVPSVLGAHALTAPPARAVTEDIFDTVRKQWLSTLIGDVPTSDGVVATYVRALAKDARTTWESLDTSEDRTFLWSDLDSRSVSAIQTTAMVRLRSLALALKTPGSSMFGNAQLTRDLLSALDWFMANKYGSVEAYDNWWDFEVGIPLALNDFCVVMYDELTADQIESAVRAITRYAPDPTVTGGRTSTGANRTWAGSIALVRGALARDADVLQTAHDAFAPVFDYSTGKDGFYPDGGFVQHEFFSYNGSYGYSLLQYLTYSMVAAKGTPWDFTPAQVQRLYDWTQDNFRPWIYRGAFMDMTRGRALSRFYETDHQTGRLTVATLVQLAEVFPSQQAEVLRSQCKGWIVDDDHQDYFAYDPVPIEQVRISSIVQGRALLADHRLPIGRESNQPVIAHSMARAVHRRPAFALGIAMDSAKIKPYESVNKENLQGWYTGEGATYLYLPGQAGHWADEYWPTADKYRIPGTTVEVKELPLGLGRRTTNAWTGGAVIPGGFAAVGMGLSFEKQKLTARKSWFCFGDEVVCLGSGITATDGADIETIVENRNTGENGSAIPTMDGRRVLRSPSSTPRTFTPRWVHLPGVGGYIFPAGTRVHALREDRSGQWTDMDHRGTYEDPATYTRRYVTMWLDHGVDPSDATYEYRLLPGATPRRTAHAAHSRDVHVVANTAQVHAVTQGSSGVTMANFWADDAPTTAGITVEGTGCVVTRRIGNRLQVTFSDPTGSLDTVLVAVETPARRLLSADDGVRVVSTHPQTRLEFTVDGLAGADVTATLLL